MLVRWEALVGETVAQVLIHSDSTAAITKI